MLKDALPSFKAGKFIVLYDGADREGEADLVIRGSFASPAAIRTLRRDAGGLICLATSGEMMGHLGIDYMASILRGSKLSSLNRIAISKTPYGDESAFSISINHKLTFTGITDKDRSRTITELSRLIKQNNGIADEFSKAFYSPGHVPLLFSRDLNKRRGHTELAVEICSLARLPAAAVVCEMLGEDDALGYEQARAYAEKNNYPFIEGKEVWGNFKNRK